MSDEQPTASDHSLELAGAVKSQPALPRRIVDWAFSSWMKDEPENSFDWQQDTRRAYSISNRFVLAQFFMPLESPWYA